MRLYSKANYGFQRISQKTGDKDNLTNSQRKDVTPRPPLSTVYV
jgi:hypothetical protein